MPTPLPSGTPAPVSPASPPPPGIPVLSPARLADLVGGFAARRGLWLPQVRFVSPERYYTRLEHTGSHEVWLLTWLPGQGTGIHGHGGSRGAFTVVRGELAEQTYALTPEHSSPAGPERTAAPTARRLHAGSVRTFGPAYVHQVTNRGAAPAVSIHAYSPPLTTMAYYRPLPDGRLVTDRIEGVDA